MDALAHSQLLIDSLLKSPLLVKQLGEFSSFDRGQLDRVVLSEPLNFQQKLGHLYEDALQVLLENSSSCSLLERSIQVFRAREKGGRDTLGELDYLLRLASGKVVQLELAVKFYLAIPQASGVARWPGPDARDNWDRKIRRMQEHQFQVGKCPEAKAILSDEFGVEQLETQHLLYGCLFDHSALAQSEADSVSPDCNRGQWFKRDEWSAFAPNGDLWYVPKHLWPVDLSQELIEQLESTNQQQMLEFSRDRCAMFTDGMRRYFVVSEQWWDCVFL